ncbi:hypothetical protein BDN67DRAFT_498028 [Paxillus ammoniavirescens]|nr:hypothetical protein BDN67DRAFT_498028 [Paxillus ammoniavirescens]
MNARSTTVLPDFASSDYAEARLQLKKKGVTEDLVVLTLDILWTLTNTQERQHCNESLDPKPKAAQESDPSSSAEATELCHLTLSQEQELAKREQRKESRNKAVPAPGISVPTESKIIPSPDALNKLRKGEYCELYYFTDGGLSTDNNAPGVKPFFTPLPSPKVKDLIIKDEDLAWNEFTKAHRRMAVTMQECDWADECVQTLVDFWIAIESSDLCHDGSSHSKRALLIYQGRIRKYWHSAVGIPPAFSLPNLIKSSYSRSVIS